VRPCDSAQKGRKEGRKEGRKMEGGREGRKEGRWRKNSFSLKNSFLPPIQTSQGKFILLCENGKIKNKMHKYIN
jgi:hypothetical protein